MKWGIFSLAALAFVLIALAVTVFEINQPKPSPSRAVLRSLPVCLAIGIRDKATGEGLESGIANYQSGKRSYGPYSWIDLGTWIKTMSGERVAISFDVISTINGQPASIMAHYAFDRAGVINKVDLPLRVADMTVTEFPIPTQVAAEMRTRWVWVKLDDHFQTIAYLTNGGDVGI